MNSNYATPALQQIRKAVLKAVASVDELSERFVLKGGNALDQVWRVGGRSTLDFDYSVADDDWDSQVLKQKLLPAIEQKLDDIGMHFFDGTVENRPKTALDPKGYNVSFKVIAKESAAARERNLDAMRRASIPSGVAASTPRRFVIEISRGEYTAEHARHTIDGYEILVYSIPMIFCEKMRALCQQIPNLGLRAHPTERAKDVYDLYAITTEDLHEKIDPSDATLLGTLDRVFLAKTVPLSALRMLPSQREFHRAGWPGVVNAVSKTLESYDVYYDHLDDIVGRLVQALGIVDPPI